MRDDVTMECRLSLAGRIHKMIPVEAFAAIAYEHIKLVT